MAQEPLVTVLIQTYNRRNLLETALNSAVNQTYKNIEILIGDNHSEDGTEEYCLDETKKDERIRYFRHQENIGMVGNANFLCDRIQGEYIIFLNDDDWLDLDYVEKCVNFYKDHPDYSLVTPSTILYPGNYLDFTKKIGKTCKVLKLDSKSIHNRLKTYLINQDCSGMATGCFRTSVLRKIKEAEGQYIVDRYNEDIIFYMKFLVSGKCKVLTDTHLNKRDDGFSKDLKTSDNVYTTSGITNKNLPRRRCQIFSEAILTDKYFATIFNEEERNKLHKKVLNSLQWFYCQGIFTNRKYLQKINGILHMLFHIRLYRL